MSTHASSARVVRVDATDPDPRVIAEAGLLLLGGRLVAFPTETVYGLGAVATDDAAVATLFGAKGRPADNPLIVHGASLEMLLPLVAVLPPLARSLAERFWPGPLTLVVEAAPGVSPVVTAGLSTVALRVPDHPVARALLQAVGTGVAAPSANASGRPSPTTAAHVAADLGDAVALILDGGPCRVGVESTVVDARGDRPIVLREGDVARADLDAVDVVGDLAASPGTRHRHYAPSCRVVVAPPGRAGDTAADLARDARVGLVATTSAPEGVVEVGRFIDGAGLAAGLYAWLRAAEDVDVDVVVVEAVSTHGVGAAVMDRLHRAATATTRAQNEGPR